MLGPAGSFVPVLAGDDIEFAVAVDIGEGGGLGGAEVDSVFLERDFAGAAGRPRDGAREAEAQRENSLLHAHDCTTCRSV